MEHLICDLKEKLILRRKYEFDRAQKYNIETDKEILMISSGKIFELDHLIGFLEEMLRYNNQTKKITQ